MEPVKEKEIIKEFCKDLCDELVMPGALPPEYPAWAKRLAFQMVKLGWRKEEVK